MPTNAYHTGEDDLLWQHKLQDEIRDRRNHNQINMETETGEDAVWLLGTNPSKCFERYTKNNMFYFWIVLLQEPSLD